MAFGVLRGPRSWYVLADWSLSPLDEPTAMNLAFSTLLHACDPARNHWRAYRVEAGQDLFGDWLVEITFGRIGPGGRTVQYLALDEEGARKLTRACLHRRTSAPRRIGVAYRELSRFDPMGWTGAAQPSPSQVAISGV